jgi:tetratricopeptide (TPR) repeat protein
MEFKLSPDGERKRRAAALTQLGIDLHDRGRYDDAVAAFEQALALEPDRVRAIRGKALCLSQLGKAQEALAYAEKAVELARYPGLSYATLGLVLHRLGRREDAEKAFQLGLENTPDDFRVYYNFACYWAEVGDEEECRRHLALALELAPESFLPQPPQDPDMARYSRHKWFADLLAARKRRVADWRPAEVGVK